MRLNYYKFPEGTAEEILLKNGCGVILKNGETIYPDTIPEDKRHLVDDIETVIGGCSVTFAKRMLRQYGGAAWTNHIDRDGGLFETSAITLKDNNSRFKYNRHL